MKDELKICFLLILTFMSTAAGAVTVREDGTGTVSSVRTEWGRDSLRLYFTLCEEAKAAGSDYAVVATPRLTDGAGDTLLLSPVTFRGRRNMRYVTRTRFFGNAPQASTDELPLGSSVTRTTVVRRGEAPWLWSSPSVSIDVKREREGCCDVVDMPPVALASTNYVVPFTPVFSDVPDNTGKAGALQKDNPVLQHISEYRPYDKTRILRKEKGALYVHFPLDKWTLLHDFRNNAATLDRIVSLTRDIMADSTSSVKCIQIIGLASVEGPQKRNLRLGYERAQALKRYVQQHVPTPDSLYECVNGGEAWTELRSQIEDGSFPGRDALLNIIDNEPDADRREARIKSLDGGKPYRYLKDNVLRDQRNSGYLRIYYDYVPDSAARTINSASALMREQRYGEALSMLRGVQDDPRSWNALGVALYMTGSKDEAVSSFRRAAARGDKQAQDNLRGLELEQ